MTTYVMIHGAGDVGWYWHLTAGALRERGHDVIAMDLPCDDESAGWSEYADAVVEAIGERKGVVVVGQSLGGFTAPLVCDRVPVDRLVLVAGMVPAPGETANDWWANTGHDRGMGEQGEQYDEFAMFFHDVPADLATQAMAKARDQAAEPLGQPWPLESWPDVPTSYLLCRDDRLFPADWTRQLVRERLGIVAEEIDGGHCIALSRPKELAERLGSYA